MIIGEGRLQYFAIDLLIDLASIFYHCPLVIFALSIMMFKIKLFQVTQSISFSIAVC